MIISDLEEFLKGIKEKKNYPQRLKLNISFNKIDDEEAKALATALQSGQCPQGLQLNFSNSQIGIDGLEALTTALKSG